MDVHELLMTSARAVAVYVLMLIVIRALGKRTVGNFSAFDLLIALMLGELVDEIIYGDVGFLKGMVAVVTLAGLAAADAFGSYTNHGIQTLLEGKPTVIVRDGDLVQKGMRAERLNRQDVMAMLRLEGVQDVGEVRLGVIETDGELSVLRYEWAEPASKADVDPAAAKTRDEALGRDEPVRRSSRTDTPAALGEV
jgi:uncharacterized membrane protein YcaP (DUF421 family)